MAVIVRLSHSAPSRVWQHCRVRSLFFTCYGLAWSTTRGSVATFQVGGSVNLSRFTHHPLKLAEKGEVELF